MREQDRADSVAPTVIRPAPALLSPLWLIALALLLANDRWLKYADLAPGWLTGKLSDLAGMIVAPVLLAVLLGVRRRGGLLACHVAVAVVFSAIKLSPACAQAWSWSMGLLGYPWTIVLDPTDLLALPMLLLSWRVLLPYMDPDSPVLVPLQRSAVAGLAALGLWSSVATTESPPPEPIEFQVQGNLYLHNAGGSAITYHVRPLRDTLRFDCDEVSLDPGRLLAPEAFGDAEYWQLNPGFNVGISIDGDDCGAVWIAGDGLAPTILFIHFDEYRLDWWPSFTDEGEEVFDAGLSLEAAADGTVSWTGGEDVRFVPRTNPVEQPPACEPSAAESRIQWSDEIPDRAVEIVSMDAGLDGCFELTLLRYEIQNGEVWPWEAPFTWYLCMPSNAMPFAVGEYVLMDLDKAASGTQELTMTLLDPTTLEPMMGSGGEFTSRLRLLHGGTDPQFIGPAIDLELEAVIATDCPWTLEPGCATAERTAQLREVGSTQAFPLGEPVMFTSPLVNRTLVLTHMRQRAVVDQACTDGAAILSYDIDLALVEEAG